MSVTAQQRKTHDVVVRRGGYVARGPCFQVPSTGSREQMPGPKLISLLDLDPDLAALIPEEVRPAARRRAMVRIEDVERGPWQYPPLRDPAAFGLLMIDGLIGARVEIGDEAYVEVLGEGDLLRPWLRTVEDSVPSKVGWQAFEDTRIAMLDERFARAVAPWPQVPSELMHRLILRARRLTFQLALAGVERIDERLMIALWHFADRWGTVTLDGVVVRLALTHAQLAEVIHAARPSVSTAISELRRTGLLAVDRRSCKWTLLGEPPPVVGRLKEQIGLP